MNDKTGLILGITVSALLIALMYFIQPGINKFESTLLPDAGPTWYYWKLPQRNVINQVITWVLYLLHQVSMWYLFYIAQKHKTEWNPKLRKINYVALGLNLLFILLHYIQTQLFYDGLAQDTPIWTSQDSVILFLSLMLIIKNPVRGLIFGKKPKISIKFTEFLRKEHAYYFLWAFIYTFWFHPVTLTWAHATGFFYMFLLLLQGSLMYTPVHVNKYWTTLLESLVLLHGVIVAISLGQAMWPMFFLGFLGMVVFTYIYGLGINKAFKIIINLGYILTIIWMYSSFGYSRPVTNLLRLEMFWIPLILYLLALGISLIGARIYSKVSH